MESSTAEAVSRTETPSDEQKVHLSEDTPNDYYAEDRAAECMPGRDAYKMSNKRRGKFLIISNAKFSRASELPDNEKFNPKHLKETFEWLGFKVDVKLNLTVSEMELHTKTVAQEDHSDADCFGMAILSHGTKDGLVCGTDSTVKIDTLLAPIIASKTLYGKLKLFFIKACRGSDRDYGVVVESCVHKDSASVSNSLPNVDVLCCYATTTGYVGYSGQQEAGYVKALCRVLRERRGKWNMHRILIEVNRILAYDLALSENRKQMSSFESILTRDLIFPEA